MAKTVYILVFIVGILVNSRNLHSDQPNGEPWSESTHMEPIHEIIIFQRRLHEESTGCDPICEMNYEEIQEEVYEQEESYEWSEIKHEVFCPFC